MTIENFKEKHFSNYYWDENSAKELAIEFAKYHVQNALKSQGKLAKRCMTNKSSMSSLEFLASSYPLENIK